MERATHFSDEEPPLLLYEDGTPRSSVFTPDGNGGFTPESRSTGVRGERERDFFGEKHAGAAHNGAGN